MSVALISLLGATLAIAPGQCEHVTIACSNGASPQLIVLGPPDVLSGQRAIELPPGIGLLKSLYVREALVLETAAGDDACGKYCQLQSGHQIALQRVDAGREISCIEPWKFATVLAHDGEVFVLPQCENGEIREKLMPASNDMTPSQGVFQLIDKNGVYRPSAPFVLRFQPIDHDLPVKPPSRFVCPMRCEGEKTYDEAILCPVCNMKLRDQFSHMDHSPRHGGQFFMAPDGVHHLEGALFDNREFRLYSYDEFTRPIDAAGLSAVGIARTTGSIDERSLILERNSTGEYQSVVIDADVAFPIRVKIRVTYSGSQEPSVYDFEFEKSM